MNLDVQTFFADLNKANMKPIQKVPINFFNEEMVSEPIELDSFPTPVREYIDRLAVRILDPDNRKTIILGYSFAGKTFLIEQLVYNINHYLKQSSLNKMHFISINEVDMLELGNVNKLKEYVQNVKTQLNASSETLCFITDSPEVSLYISSVIPKSRIILELNVNSFMLILNSSAKTASKLWDSWHVIDTNMLYCTRDELIELLWVSITKRLNNVFNKQITKRRVRIFVEKILETFPQIEQFDEENNRNVIIVPPGAWATCLRNLFGLINYSCQDEKIDIETYKTLVIESLIENEDLFNKGQDETVQINENDLPEAILNIIKSEGGKVVAINSNQKTEPDITPFIFNDMPSLKKRLSKTIIGQDEAITKLVDGLKVPAAGLNDPEKPIRSFLFLGPTGVGKTKLALDLAKEISDKEINLIRIDMSEYQKSHEVSKLFGAPPGYLGYEEGGILTSAVIENPKSIVLLDEIEKAHPKIWDAFLQIFDSGHMTDSQGNVVDFSKTILIMTSNLGISEVNKPNTGFISLNDSELFLERKNNSRSIIMKAVEKEFRPEFINRIDELIIFNELSEESAKEIIRREIKIISSRIKDRGIIINEPDNNVIQNILDKADISKYGAREIQRIVFRNISSKIADYIVNNNESMNLSLKCKTNEIVIVEN